MGDHRREAERAVHELMSGIEELALILSPTTSLKVLDDAIVKVNGKAQKEILQAAKQITMRANEIAATEAAGEDGR